MVDLNHAEQQFMKRKIFASFAIVSPTSDLPYNTTVWAYWDESTKKFYVITNKGTAKWKFLKNGNTKVGINITDPKGWPYISVNGEVAVHFEKDRNDFWTIIKKIIEKYNSGSAIDEWLLKMKSAPKDKERMLLELEPTNFMSTV